MTLCYSAYSNATLSHLLQVIKNNVKYLPEHIMRSYVSYILSDCHTRIMTLVPRKLQHTKFSFLSSNLTLLALILERIILKLNSKVRTLSKFFFD